MIDLQRQFRAFEADKFIRSKAGMPANDFSVPAVPSLVVMICPRALGLFPASALR
jgi:hypothetical protein